MPSWRENKVSKTLGLKENPKELKLHHNSLDLNEIDKDIYHDLTDQYDAMAENLESGLKEYAPFDYLSEDIYNSLFKHTTDMHDADEMHSFARFNHEMIKGMMESEAYQELRKSTRFDTLSSAMATEAMQSQIMEKIQYYKQQLQVQRDTGQAQPGADVGEYIEQLNGMKEAQDTIDGLTGGTGSADGLSPEDAAALAKAQSDLAAQEREAAKNKTGKEQFENAVAKDVDQSAREAKATVDEIRDIVNAWGLEAGQSGKRISLDTRKKSIERIRRSPKLRDLTDMIGRMKRIALSSKKQKLPDGHSIKSVKTGNQLESIIPSELMKLASPSTKKDFIRRYHQKQLLQYDKEDISNTGRGPIVVCHDKSGSMHGERDDWATALSLATLEIAQKEKRNYGYIPYNGDIMRSHIKDIPAGELDPDDIMDIAELETCGGTNFERPIVKALEFIKRSDYKKADLLFITDGDCGLSDEFVNYILRTKADKKFFINTVLIDICGGAGLNTVKRFSDNITTISNISEMGMASAKDIFKIVENDQKFTPDPNANTNVPVAP